MTCNVLRHNREVTSWPGFVDPEAYFAIKRFRMKMVNIESSCWIEKTPQKNELAEKRNVNLVVRIHDVLGTGLGNSECVSLGVIEVTQSSEISVKTADIKDTQVPEYMKMSYNTDTRKIQEIETPKVQISTWFSRFSCFSCFI